MLQRSIQYLTIPFMVTVTAIQCYASNSYSTIHQSMDFRVSAN